MSIPSALSSLARCALGRGAGIIALGAGHEPILVPGAPRAATGVPAEPLLGVSCTASAHAVAYPAEIVVDDGSRLDDLVVGIAVDRRGAVAVVDPTSARPRAPSPADEVAVDIGRRALGLPTPPPTRTLQEFVAAWWLDRVLDAVLLADLGDPPRWRVISRCHPLAMGAVLSPVELRSLGERLGGDWESLRRSVAASTISGPVVSAALARWCDEGAFARRLCANVADPEAVLDDLRELLRPRDAERLRAAFRPPLHL